MSRLDHSIFNGARDCIDGHIEVICFPSYDAFGRFLKLKEAPTDGAGTPVTEYSCIVAEAGEVFFCRSRDNKPLNQHDLPPVAVLRECCVARGTHWGDIPKSVSQSAHRASMGSRSG